MIREVIIDKNKARRIVSLVSWIYNLGVESAAAVNDEGLANEFLERTSQAGVYGFLEDDFSLMDWQEWLLRIKIRIRGGAYYSTLKWYSGLMGAFGANYLSALLPVMQAFYNKGVCDYMNAPGAANVAAFSASSRSLWTPKGVRRIDTEEWIGDIRVCDYNIEHRDTDIWKQLPPHQAKKIALRPNQHKIWRRVMGSALQKE